MMTFFLVVHGLLAVALVAVILLQRSEGGGLGIGGGGSPGGLMSARGAADLLTRTTAVLATLFILSSLGLAIMASGGRDTRAIDTTLQRGPAPASPGGFDPAPGTGQGPAGTPAPFTVPAPAPAPARPVDTVPVQD